MVKLSESTNASFYRFTLHADAAAAAAPWSEDVDDDGGIMATSIRINIQINTV